MTRNTSGVISPEIQRALTIATGLKFYARTGKRINTAYTPKNMMRVAEQVTGKTFAPKDYMGAYQALIEWADKEAGL